jgi:histidinol-phosphate aminotransferase
VAVLKTFSKIYGLAGIRVGYGLVPAPLAAAVDKVREPFNVNTPAQLAAAASLGDAVELQARQSLNASGRARLEAAFAALGLKFYRSQANYVWVEVPDAQAGFDGLLRRGVIVRPFPAANGLRVTVGTEAACDATIAAFKELYG